MDPTREAFVQHLRPTLESYSLNVSEAHIDLMYHHYRAVVVANAQFNLTRIVDAVEAAAKHYADSLMLSVWVKRSGIGVRRILDVGTGAGFPAVPLAVMQADWQVTAIDSTAKKAAFLAGWIAEEKVPNLTARHARAEHWTGAERFDVVTFRATGSLAKCLTQARGVLVPRGLVVCFKSRVLPVEETAEARRAAKSLGFRSEPPFEYDLNCQGDVLARQLMVFRLG